MSGRPPASQPRRRSAFASRLVNSAVEGGQPQVLADLRRAILAGDEPPGTVIPIDEVARFFGVSQIPVRESLKILTGEGLVEHRPHVGYSVAMVTAAEFRELYVVRQALEAAALRAAVRRATLDDDEAVRGVLDHLGQVTGTDDERAYHALSRQFHMQLIAPSGMQRLMHMYESAWNITEPARPMARVAADERRGFHDDHEQMLAAFVARDADTLVAASLEHFGHLASAIAAMADDPTVFRPDDRR